jgi:hypothetical protein
MVFFGEISVFFQLSLVGLFGGKRTYLHLETPVMHEVFLLKTYSILIVKLCARGFCFQHRGLSFMRYMFPHFSSIGLFWTKWVFLHLENSDLRELSFRKLTQFSHAKKVLDATASITNEFVSGDTQVSSTQLNRPIWNKDSISPCGKS